MMGQARNWTPEEKQYLSDNWGSLSVGTLTKNLNRSENAIRVMAQRLGLGAFLESGDYITWNQFLIAIGYSESGYQMKSWVENRGFPIHTKRVSSNSFKIVYIDEFWVWAKKNRDFLDFSRFEENVFGAEPEWVKEKRRHDFEKHRRYTMAPWTQTEDDKLVYLLSRKKYNYADLSKMLGRTSGAIQRRIIDLGIKERPVKADNHIRWTEEELKLLGELIKQGYGYELIAERLKKSSKAVRGRVYAMYLTENLDKARELLGEGAWGENRPERKIKQWNVMNTQERTEVRDLMIKFTAVLHREFRQQLEQTEWGEFFQKDMCRNFCSECFKTSGCDDCEDYKKIEPQACKMCGKTFYEKKNNNFCSVCRNMRKKQYLRKRAVLGR